MSQYVYVGLLYFGEAVRQNNGQLNLALARNPVKFRGWLLTLLFVHVLLHPLVHMIGTTGAANGLAE